ncbi:MULTISPECIES: DUF1800 domain-containing protein [unclassified Mucilaginibacter]|uniref:DUF1800 domain-containing protein n=1 Tax=unclassified Mucilaginibacter TaxID=2617802 RepID=UPI002AC9B643|nr:MULTISPECIES: DUF1800 domain-containing protein [unclassified Mucilaginibacter]MEB0263005.1 DUF1800 domain-containing protein [Mucilaginibacter sp. 10I4]MEB0279655.1 DUF1800 domain-containing protein [Mucilaginibacter sp. 10B2]MEB0302964.1 DUF1800 domain-containing protein [Mucilaginibacter sp. 5C4]WPX23785.1 DUF1800 domain-containing protein [Mucilaginibacter sp. 5C4]
MDNTNRIKHLYARAGFGLRVADLQQVKALTVKHSVEDVFKASAEIKPLTVVATNENYKDAAKADSLTKKMFMQQQRQFEKDLNISWITQMSTADMQLREKMTLFWHNHFACRTQNAFYAQQLNNIQRTNALGNFKTLLLEVSKSPAMLQFLNNQQNKKGHPNENFARELMELFTIGRGNYTEQDVKESARAFTGWGFNNDGVFVERKVLHDEGQKAFLGKTGAFTGEGIIDILLDKKETAQFICTKLYKYLVNETPDAVNVNTMANVFYNSGYDISKLLKFVFTADWFYADKNIGNLIKSPVDFIVGLNRQFYIDYKNPDVIMQFERALGQVLFYPPNVAGWPGGKSWIDSSSLMFRLKIPSTVLNDGVIDFKGKADPEDEAFLAMNINKRKAVNTQVQSQPNWDKFLSGIPAHTSKASIAGAILAPALNSNIMAIVNRSTDIRSMVIELVSTPEYQLC